jgi:hypothetical protein
VSRPPGRGFLEDLHSNNATMYLYSCLRWSEPGVLGGYWDHLQEELEMVVDLESGDLAYEIV